MENAARQESKTADSDERSKAGIGKSNGLFHRPRPPTPCHSAPAGVLSQITENRKVEVCKSLIFHNLIFGFCLKKANLRQNRLTCWSNGMASSPTRRASCPSRLRSLVCKILISLHGLSETNTIGYYLSAPAGLQPWRRGSPCAGAYGCQSPSPVRRRLR